MNAPPAPTARRRRKGAAFAVLFGCLVALGGFVVLRGRASSPLPDDGSDPTVGAAGPAPAPLAGASRPGLSPPSPAPKDAPDTIGTLPSEDRLTDEAFRALETDVEGGRIEGVVMSGTRPHGGGHARLWPDYMARTFGDSRGQEPLATVPIAADGTFRVEGFAPGEYGLEIAAEGVATRLMFFTIPDAPGKTQRVVLALEDAGVAGRVFDRVGKPAVGAVVHVHPSQGSRAFPMNCETRAGADGAYEIGGLRPGTYWIVTHLGADWWKARDDRTLSFQAKAGEIVSLDLGSERGDPLWTGVLKTTGGKRVRGPGELVFGAQGNYGGYDTTPFDANGEFSKRLAPGTYGVNAKFPGDGGEWLRVRIAVVVGDRDLAQDLVVPGARVSGVVRDMTSGRILVGSRGQSAGITPEGRDHHSRRSVTLGEDGSFVIDGVEPGRYVVSGWPAALRDASRGTITFEVREGVPEVTVEAWVQVD